MIVHQFLPTFELGAVGSHSILARDALRAAGHTSEIYAAEVHPSCAREGAHELRDYRGDADVLVYQMAIGSVAADAALAQHEPLVVNYHNLTPVRFYAGWQHVAAQGLAWGRAQLRELATRAVLGVADSHFNEADLIEAGFARTGVAPVLVDLRSFDAPETQSVARAAAATWLFVGRLAPNKAQHDIVKAFAAYRRFHDPGARLELVGGGTDEAYGKTLARFVHALGLDDGVSMPGSVPASLLAVAYRRAHVLVVASEHEGFCVPLLEAMYHGVPIVAYDAAAVPETLGDAGLLLSEKDPCTLAAAVHRVLTNDALRDQLVAAGTRRVREFDVSRTAHTFVDAVTAAAR
jgi:L-malate glycosyltransferase